MLTRRPRPLPWAFGYAPRGPVAKTWDEASIEALTTAIRTQLGRTAGRVAHVRIDPEVERDGPLDPDGGLRRSLRRAGWRPGATIQPDTTRIIDLRSDEEALWGDLRKKWRQYVNRARTLGFRVVDAEGDRLPEFYAIYRETAARAGFLIRTAAAYRDVWEAYRPTGQARLLFAEDRDGVPQAALFLVRCGPRVVEPYGGMTAAGAESRANYLLKWEAIRSSREQGRRATTCGAWQAPGSPTSRPASAAARSATSGPGTSVLDPLGKATFETAQKGRVWIARRRHGLGGRRGPSGEGASEGADA